MPRAKNRGKASDSMVAGNANRRRIDAESVKGKSKMMCGGAAKKKMKGGGAAKRFLGNNIKKATKRG
jgi:hypothetical protein|tara:strand:+ start:1075 stop:1275 length:201 start_codon:yes stop_codon:yes gene_type:complete